MTDADLLRAAASLSREALIELRAKQPAEGAFDIGGLISQGIQQRRVVIEERTLALKAEAESALEAATARVAEVKNERERLLAELGDRRGHSPSNSLGGAVLLAAAAALAVGATVTAATHSSEGDGLGGRAAAIAVSVFALAFLAALRGADAIPQVGRATSATVAITLAVLAARREPAPVLDWVLLACTNVAVAAAGAATGWWLIPVVSTVRERRALDRLKQRYADLAASLAGAQEDERRRKVEVERWQAYRKSATEYLDSLEKQLRSMVGLGGDG